MSRAVALPSLEALERLYAERGERSYGEGVTQIEHALQCAALAQVDGAPPSLVVAALLHDVGHLFEDDDDAPEDDARHENVGALALKALFGEDVRKPIALHVAAKRYLCLTEPDYLRTLSPASLHSLKLQGGPFTAGQAAAFERQPYGREAVALRRYDDLGKRLQPVGLSMADFRAMMRSVSLGAPV
ncbi:MAG TPA: HD domain-containing protein [Caulobacteraceae bacterium]|nr:HD domain-containing protein [Caulobacteraceae bacterium]